MKRVLLAIAVASCAAGCFGAHMGEHAEAPTPERVTTRDFLIGDQPEAKDYGLYSYLLFGAPPLPASRELYLRTIAAYLEEIPPTAGFGSQLQRWQMNITYLPLTEPPPAQFTAAAGQIDAAAAADWMLRHYNYVRARLVLRTLPGSYHSGPYLVSHLKPLSGSAPAAGPFLFQDLSNVQPDLAAVWMREFLVQAGKERFWEPDAVGQFRLQLRNAIAVAGATVPGVQAAVEKWIKVL